MWKYFVEKRYRLLVQFRESSHCICSNSGAFGKEEICSSFGTGMAPFPLFWTSIYVLINTKVEEKYHRSLFISYSKRWLFHQNFEVKQTWWILYSLLKWHSFILFPYYFSIFGTGPHWCREYCGPMSCEGNGVRRFLTMFNFEIQTEIEFKLDSAGLWSIPLSILGFKRHAKGRVFLSTIFNNVP